MQNCKSVSRRRFVRAAAGLLIVPSTTAFGSRANSSLGLGIIGCGGRGRYDGRQFLTNTNSRVTALHDVFVDQLAQTRSHLDETARSKGLGTLSEANIFRGSHACHDLLQSKDVDVVLITSPPYFHPEHFEAAVAAGKHVYLEKPVATDVIGCQRVLTAARIAAGKVSVHVGFQKRYAVGYQRLISRIHAGDLGEIVLGQSFYYTNDLGRQNKAGMSAIEGRVRNWVFDQALSGDILVEQNIHIIDTVNWALRSHPIKAQGICGRATRKQVDAIPPDFLCHDHFIMTFTYPSPTGEIHVSFNSNQFRNRGYRQQGERFFGTKGVSESFQGGPATITLNQTGDQQSSEKLDQGRVNMDESVAEKMKAFALSIETGKYENQAEQGAEATLSTILGRMAAYSGKEMSWDKMLKSNQKWDLRLDFESLGK